MEGFTTAPLALHFKLCFCMFVTWVFPFPLLKLYFPFVTECLSESVFSSAFAN